MFENAIFFQISSLLGAWNQLIDFEGNHNIKNVNTLSS